MANCTLAEPGREIGAAVTAAEWPSHAPQLYGCTWLKTQVQRTKGLHSSLPMWTVVCCKSVHVLSTWKGCGLSKPCSKSVQRCTVEEPVQWSNLVVHPYLPIPSVLVGKVADAKCVFTMWLDAVHQCMLSLLSTRADKTKELLRCILLPLVSSKQNCKASFFPSLKLMNNPRQSSLL